MYGQNRKHSVNFTVNGAFEITHPELTRTFLSLQQRAPHLFSHLATYGREIEKPGNTADGLNAVADSQHLEPVVQIRISPQDIQKRSDLMISVLFPHRLDIAHPFRSGLLDAYNNEYNISGLVSLGTKGIQWAQRIRFTVP